MFKFFIQVGLLFGFAIATQAQINGYIFKDFNGDGVWQPAIEPPAKDVWIDAYDDANVLIASTTSSATGYYNLAATVPVRVEYIVGKGTCMDSTFYFSVKGAKGNNVRFLNPPILNEDYGINNPTEFDLQIDPLVFVPRLNSGDPLDTVGALLGSSNNQRAFYAHRLYENAPSNTYVPPYALKNQAIGSCWGVAYNKKAKKVFTAAFLKRTAGLGPLGSGGIYKLDTTAAGGFTVTNFYDMDANGHRTRAASTAVGYGLGTSFNLNATSTEATYLGPVDALTGLPEGAGVIGTNAQRMLTKNVSPAAYYDPAAYDQVGKVGLGDMEFSDDGKFLYVMNLYSRLLFRLEMDNAFNPQFVTDVKSYALPSIVVNNGVIRPFSISYQNCKVYIGAVSTAENGGTVADMNAYVFELLSATDSAYFNPVPTYILPLNYSRPHAPYTTWHPWNRSSAAYTSNKYWVPMLSNIDFTDNGDLILDFMDRSGHHHGIGNPRHLAAANAGGIGFYTIGGDILVAGFDCATGNYTGENNGSYTSQGNTYTSIGTGNTYGPGGGEFFVGDLGTSSYVETMVGALAKKPHCDSFIVTAMGHVGIVNNGTKHLSLTTGLEVPNTKVHAAASTPNFAKSNSLGDIEMVGDALPILIGNRVWADSNGNGIQDATEAGIANVNINLFADFNKDGVPDGTALSATVTDINGLYYFNEANVADGDPVATGSQQGISAHTNYIVSIDSVDWLGTKGIADLGGLSITAIDTLATTINADIRDNDAALTNGVPQINVRTSVGGKNLFNVDFGFKSCVKLDLGDKSINCNQTNVIIGPSSLPVGSTFEWAPPGGLSSTSILNPIASPITTTVYTLTVDKLCVNTLTVTSDQNIPTVNTGISKSISCFDNLNGVYLGSTDYNPLYTYKWETSAGIINIDSSQIWVNPNTTTVYTLTVTSSNGCVNVGTVTVNVNKCCTRVTIPNSFTPNGDGLNDEFGVIELENLTTFSLQVFDRFGNKVFEANNDKNKKWDGKYKGKLCDYGTYFYLVKYDCSLTKDIGILKGDVTLFK